MTNTLPHLLPAAQASLQRWHDMVSRSDMSELGAILHPDAVFRSPMAFTPYRSAAAVMTALGTVIHVFKEFTYHRQFAADDGLNAVLEFSAKVGDKSVKGIDLIRFDENGLIVDFEVMVRPMSGLQALGEEMGKRLGQRLHDFR